MRGGTAMTRQSEVPRRPAERSLHQRPYTYFKLYWRKKRWGNERVCVCLNQPYLLYTHTHSAHIMQHVWHHLPGKTGYISHAYSVDLTQSLPSLLFSPLLCLIPYLPQYYTTQHNTTQHNTTGEEESTQGCIVSSITRLQALVLE